MDEKSPIYCMLRLCFSPVNANPGPIDDCENYIKSNEQTANVYLR